MKSCDDKKRNFCHKEKRNDKNEHHGGVVGISSKPFRMHLLPAEMGTKISQTNIGKSVLPSVSLYKRSKICLG